MNERLIATSDPESADAALREIQLADREAHLAAWLAPGVALVSLGVDWGTFAGRFRERPPVFCRHICPADATVQLRQQAVDLDRLGRVVRRFGASVGVTEKFSVQTRLLGAGWPYGRYDVNQRLSSALLRQGARLDVRHPAQVVSVVLGAAQGYLGVSRQNLTVVVRRLESQGHLERTVGKDDKRSRRIKLTPEGRRMWRRDLQPAIRDYYSAALDGFSFSDEVSMLHHLNRLFQNLSVLDARHGEDEG